MKTVEINLYKFNELSEEAKQKVIEENYDINVLYDWWNYDYEDAENVGLKITGFDIDRGNFCDIQFMLSAVEVALNILNEHGEKCDTYINAQNFLNEHNPKFAEYMNENSEHYESGEMEEDLLYLENEFLRSLSEDYLSMLRSDYEYRISEEAIIETIECNSYDFTENGEMY